MALLVVATFYFYAFGLRHPDAINYALVEMHGTKIYVPPWQRHVLDALIATMFICGLLAILHRMIFGKED